MGIREKIRKGDENRHHPIKWEMDSAYNHAEELTRCKEWIKEFSFINLEQTNPEVTHNRRRTGGNESGKWRKITNRP